MKKIIHRTLLSDSPKWKTTLTTSYDQEYFYFTATILGWKWFYFWKTKNLPFDKRNEDYYNLHQKIIWRIREIEKLMENGKYDFSLDEKTF